MNLQKRTYRLFHQLVAQLPYGFSFNKFRLLNARSARNTIRFCKDLGFQPNTLVDLGANESQWAYWLKKQWPNLRVISVEPQPDCHPIGEVHRCALSNASYVGKMTLLGGASKLDMFGSLKVEVKRFDQLNLDFCAASSLLKVDCENSTYEVLQGVGSKLCEFPVIVVEMWNYHPRFIYNSWQFKLINLMRHYGKDHFLIVDAETELSVGKGIPSYDMLFF